jgi:hypothetical protein
MTNSRSSIIDPRVRYRAAARRLRNTGLRDRSMGSFDGLLAWIEVACEQLLGYWVPGPAQCEAIISVDVHTQPRSRLRGH